MKSRSVLGCVGLALVAGCGGTVVFSDEGAGGAGGESNVSASAVGPTTGTSTSSTSATTSTSTSSSSVVSSSSASSTSVSVTTSTGSGPFGEPDLFPQDMGPPSNDRNRFTLSPGALGAQLIARTPSNQGTAVLQRLTAPSGSNVFNGPLPSNGAEFFGYGAISTVVPQISHPESFPPAVGEWSLRVTQTSPDTNLTAFERRTVDGAFHGGVLDVNVFLVPGVSDPDYLLSQIEGGFSDFAGIELGEVRFYDAPDSLYEVDEFNYFEAQEVTAAAPVGQAVTFLVVGYIGGQLQGAAGFSPGAPADPIGHGSSSSTLVWMAQNDDFFDRIIVRHETGHYAGLFHTSEFEPGLVDALDDTPECQDVFAQFESCPDYDNVMFPTGGSFAGLLSPLQVQVLRASALYRGVYAEGQLPAAPLRDLVAEGVSAQAIASSGGLARATSLALDGLGTAATSPVAGPTPRAVLAGLAPEVVALDGAACGTNGDAAAQLDRAARASSARELVELAKDGRATTMLRRRALLAAARAPGASAIVGDLRELAKDTGLAEGVRAGAIHALELTAPAEHAALAPTLRGDASRLVRHLAR